MDTRTPPPGLRPDWIALVMAAGGAIALAAACDPGPQSVNQLGPSGGVTNPPTLPANGNFDEATFASVIQPILDSADGKGCTAAACHGAPGGQSGFALKRTPAAGSVDMEANLAAVAARCDPNNPGQSLVYQRATSRHANGASALVSQQQAIQLLTWIQKAAPPQQPNLPPTPTSDPDAGAGTSPGGNTTPPGGANCVQPENFNLALFTTQIQPMLFGQIDYNTPPGQPFSDVGCSRATCHGTNRGAGTLFLSEQNTPLQNLQSFGCYVNQTVPSNSAILDCPLNAPGCPKSPHPGQNVFRDASDRNFQRMLSFLYATKTVANPLDFAFYVRAIDPIFKDPSLGGLGNTGQRSCSDTNTCHGVSVAGQTPPNLSAFPILSSSVSKDQLLVNYWSAANFANFATPQGSDLFLFPTDLTSDANQPFATGLHHPGGIDFGGGVSSQDAANSVQAQAILQWAGGLRPDNNGFQLNWLVAGTYSATQVTQPTTLGDESKVAPQIFDFDGAQQFNNGQWDALLSPTQDVDLNVTFPGNPGTGRIAYASAYVINSTASDLQNVLIQVNSPNVVLMYIDGRPVAQSNGNSTVTGITNLPAFTPQKPSTRLLLKVLQRAQDRDFKFSVQFFNQSNIPLTNTSGELILRLDGNGGL